MPGYNYIFVIVVILTILFLVRLYFSRKRSLPVQLYMAALKNENSGELEAAIGIYNNALNEAKKLRGQGDLETRIIEKLKLLNTVIAYRNAFQFRQAISHAG